MMSTDAHDLRAKREAVVSAHIEVEAVTYESQIQNRLTGYAGKSRIPSCWCKTPPLH